MSDNIQVLSSAVLTVFISSNVSTHGSERRFNKDLTVGALKGKLEMITGGSSTSMKLEAYDKDNKLVCKLDNDDALLGSYQIDDGMRIHAVDTIGQAGQYEDTSKVEKFEISQEQYQQRTDSVRAFKERMKMGRFADVDPEEQKKRDEEAAKKQAEEEEKCKAMKVNDRCEVRVPGQAARRATVLFIGTTDFKPGNWIGVKYDEPLGKNDGSVAGKRYFQCPPKYGGFVKPAHLEVGDFPEEDLDLDDDEM